jgi:hypothetical protein
MHAAATRAAVAVAFATAGSAIAPPPLFAVDLNGGFYTVNTSTGAATLVGPTGFTRVNALAANPAGEVYAMRARTVGSTEPDVLFRIDPLTGAGTAVQTYTVDTDIRGLAFGPLGRLYAVQNASASDLLVSIDIVTGVVTTIGPLGRTDVQGLGTLPGGNLIASVLGGGGQLYSVDPSTGGMTLIGGALGNDVQTVEFAGGNRAWGARANLQIVDLTTGVTTLIGPMGIADVRGLAAIGLTTPCYANCDGSTAAPVLNVNDFICFQSRFAAGDSYANCDGSTVVPVLNVNDFICFQARFAAGCP